MTRWDAEEALRLVERHRCTFMLLMPTHGADTLQAAQGTERDLSSMRVLAAPGLTPERRLAMHEAFGVPPLADYGLSEVPGHAAHGLREPEAKMVKTEGRPYDGTEIRILGPDGVPLPAGEVGDVVVNGPSRFLGFLHNDELTRESLTDWGGYRTGDLGYLDEDGYLFLADRSADLILSGGANVYPAEVEAALDAHPAVRSSAVFGLPDDDLGERVHAVVDVADHEVSPDALLAHVAERLVRYKVPRDIEVVHELLRDDSGKLRRSALRAARLAR
jgi:acyl-CoA synthetase (AMP-forming)/AMP-acid ligase II